MFDPLGTGLTTTGIYSSKTESKSKTNLNSAVHRAGEDLSPRDGEARDASFVTHQRLSAYQVVHAPHLDRVKHE